jgi:hypothetical protein
MFGLIALLVLARGAPQLLQQKPTATPVGSVHESVTVERIVITGRVIDRFANAIPGLSTADFRLRVDGKETAIESVDWIPSQSQLPHAPPVATPAETANRDVPRRKAEIPGPATQMTSSRTVVMLFQWEIAGQKDTGFVRMMRQAERMIESSSPDERIAVLAFGSSLRLLQDFTNDRTALRDAIEGIRSWHFHGRPAAAAGPSFATAIAGCGPRDSIRKALVCVGSALQTRPGPKTLLFFGWSIGRPKRDSWFLEYPAMIEAISKARTSVFVLDVSDAHHSLEPSLKLLAADTGGLFNGGCIYEMMYCADLARLKTERAIEGGAYELVFRDPATKRGWHEVEVQLVRGNGIAAFQQWFRD